MYETIQVKEQDKLYRITINRPERRNSLNATLIKELTAAIEEAGQCSNNRVILLQGQPGFFCTGMDFKAAVETKEQEMSSDGYMNLLRLIATIPRTVISAVEGVVMAGGIGIIAASDLVFATPQSQFSLSEALWGLLPCCVTPYLIRRVGFHTAYKMTLTTQTLTAQEAHGVQLADVVTDQLEAEIRKSILRLGRLDPLTLQDLKNYFRRMWIINESMEAEAVNEISRLMQTPRVQRNLSNYVLNGTFPWDNS